MYAFGDVAEDTDPAGLAFRDVLFLMVLNLVVVVFLLTFLINPVEKAGEVPIHTEILIEAFWPADTSYDVDLWGMGPDGMPVGWGVFTAGPTLNLERDDRGKINDTSTINYEMMSIRSRDPGEYTINLHLYNEFNDPLPVPVKVSVTGKDDIGQIFSGDVLLTRRKEEVTVVRFSLDEDGDLIADSIHNLYKPILVKR